MMIWSILSRLKHKRAKVKVPYEPPPVIDFYRLANLANLVAKEQVTRLNEEAYADFIAVTGALTDAAVPMDGRVMKQRKRKEIFIMGKKRTYNYTVEIDVGWIVLMVVVATVIIWG